MSSIAMMIILATFVVSAAAIGIAVVAIVVNVKKLQQRRMPQLAPPDPNNPYAVPQHPPTGQQQNPYGQLPSQNPYGQLPSQNPYGQAPSQNPYGQGQPQGPQPQQNPYDLR